MKEELFITYANLKDIPQGIYKLLRINWNGKDPRIPQKAIDEVWKINHQTFKYFLNEIISGKDPRKIPGLRTFIEYRNLEAASKEIKSAEKYRNIPELKNRLDFFEQDPRLDSPPTYYGPILDSLFSFLEDNKKGPRRLKRCPECGDFFAARDINREFCYLPKNCQRKHKTEYFRNFMRRKRDKKNPDPKYI